MPRRTDGFVWTKPLIKRIVTLQAAGKTRKEIAEIFTTELSRSFSASMIRDARYKYAKGPATNGRVFTAELTKLTRKLWKEGKSEKYILMFTKTRHGVKIPVCTFRSHVHRNRDKYPYRKVPRDQRPATATPSQSATAEA